MTFSIVARSDGGESWGVAVASKFLAVGAAVPAAVAGIGAVATQADANVAFKGELLGLLDEGATAEVALARVLEDDDRPQDRQVAVVDVDGNAASHTGTDCFDWAGSRTGPGFALQGNVLTGPEVLDAMEAGWHHSEGLPLVRRLLAALSAGDAAGGDRRGRQSAAVLVVREGAGLGGHDDIAADYRVDDHEDPVTELARLVDLGELYLSASTEDEKVPVDDTLRDELHTRARALGFDGFRHWLGSENYEMRGHNSDSPTWIDVRVLDILRTTSDAVSTDPKDHQ